MILWAWEALRNDFGASKALAGLDLVAPKARFRRDWVTYSSKYEMCLVRSLSRHLVLFEVR